MKALLFILIAFLAVGSIACFGVSQETVQSAFDEQAAAAQRQADTAAQKHTQELADKDAAANAQIAEFQESLVVANVQAASLQDQLTAANTDASAMMGQLEAERAQVDILEDQLDTARTETVDLQDQLDRANLQATLVAMPTPTPRPSPTPVPAPTATPTLAPILPPTPAPPDESEWVLNEDGGKLTAVLLDEAVEPGRAILVDCAGREGEERWLAMHISGYNVLPANTPTYTAVSVTHTIDGGEPVETQWLPPPYDPQDNFWAIYPSKTLGSEIIATFVEGARRMEIAVGHLLYSFSTQGSLKAATALVESCK